MLDKSFYHGRQGECFKQIKKYFQEIKYEFDSQPNKAFLEPEDFSDSVRGLPDDFDDKAYNQENTKAKRIMTIQYCIRYCGNFLIKLM